MRLCLHIGSEKSGTTSLQKYLGRNRDALRASGFWYPVAFTTREQVHRPLTDAVLARELDAQSPLCQAFDAEYNEANAAGIATCLVSSEHLHSLLREPSHLEYLRAFLTRYFDPIEVIYYARRQDALLVSMYSTAVLIGATTNPKPFHVYTGKGHYYFDHYAIAELWSGAFGRDRLTCRIFERNKLKDGDVIDDFEAVVGLDHDPGRVRVSANESLSLIGRHVLLRLNASRHKGNGELRQKLIATDRQNNNKKAPPLTKDEARQFLSRFQTINEMFFAKYVDPSLATQFEPGFEGFPDEVPVPTSEEMLAFVFSRRDAS